MAMLGPLVGLHLVVNHGSHMGGGFAYGCLFDLFGVPKLETRAPCLGGEGKQSPRNEEEDGCAAP